MVNLLYLTLTQFVIVGEMIDPATFADMMMRIYQVHTSVNWSKICPYPFSLTHYYIYMAIEPLLQFLSVSDVFMVTKFLY